MNVCGSFPSRRSSSGTGSPQNRYESEKDSKSLNPFHLYYITNKLIRVMTQVNYLKPTHKINWSQMNKQNMHVNNHQNEVN